MRESVQLPFSPMTLGKPIFERCLVLAVAWAPLLQAAPPPKTATPEVLAGATEAIQKGDLPAAEQALREAARLAPSDARILATLGGVLGMEQHLEESASFLQKALQLNPRDTITRRNLGATQWQSGDLQNARRNLEMVVKADRLDRQAKFLLGMLSENLGEYEAAARLLDSVPELRERQPASVTALASALYHLGKADRARSLLQSLRDARVDPQIIFIGARVAADGSDYGLAEEMFSSLRSSYSDAATLNRNIAFAQYRQGHYAACQATLSDSAAADPKDDDVHNLLAWCLEKTGKLDSAVASLQHAIELDPSRESNYLDLGAMLLAGNRLGQALEVASRGAQQLPSSYAILSLKGSIESRLQHFSDAVESYQKVVALKPGKPEPQRSLAIALWSAGRVPESARVFEDLLIRFPTQAATYEAFGGLLVTDSPARGEALLLKGLALDPSLVEANFQLGNLMLARGDAQKALPYLQAAVKLDPRRSKFHFALSRALRRAGRSSEAAGELALFEKLKTADS